MTSAVHRLLPFYFRNHKELSIDIVTQTTPENLPSNNGFTNNVCSQLVAHKLGSQPTNERPVEGFEAYTPWRLRREVFLTGNIDKILRTRGPFTIISHQDSFVNSTVKLHSSIIRQ